MIASVYSISQFSLASSSSFFFFFSTTKGEKWVRAALTWKKTTSLLLSKSFSLAEPVLPPQLMSRLLALSDGKLDWIRTRPFLFSLSLNLPFNAHIYINSHSCAQGKRNELTHQLAAVGSPRGEKENWNAKGYRVRVRAPWCFWPIWIIDPAVVNPPFYVVPNKKHYYYYYYLLDLFGRVIARDYSRCECVRRISELWSERERERLSSKWRYFLSY